MNWSRIVLHQIKSVLLVNNMLTFHKWRYLGKNGDYKLLQFLPFLMEKKACDKLIFLPEQFLIMTKLWLIRNKKLSFKKMANII